jgi:putative transposase
MQRDTRWPKPRGVSQAVPRVVSAKKPNQLWHIDLTTVPTALGFWVPWLPFALPQVWPFCWWLAVAIDHYSRRAMGFAVYRALPSSASVRRFLEAAFQEAGAIPHDLISDQGIQFTARAFRRWCHRHGIRHRFGALGKYGSLAVIERCIRTLKAECTRRLILVPYRRTKFEKELALYCSWHNGHRPHTWLMGATPDEVYHRRRQAIRGPRFEPRLANIRW